MPSIHKRLRNWPRWQMDRSAIVSGCCYFIGCQLAGLRGHASYLIPGSYILFLLFVVYVQRRMDRPALALSFGKPSRLTTTGIFARTRHPIYAAFLFPLLVLSILSVWASLASIVLYIGAMEFFVIRREEAELRKAFGQEFEAWKSRTPRWL